MKYLMFFEEIDYSTMYGRKMSMKYKKNIKDKEALLRKKFFEKYNIGTKINFIDTENNTYDAKLEDVKFENLKISELIFTLENGKNIIINNPFNIDDKYYYYISILPSELDENSFEIINKMLLFNGN